MSRVFYLFRELGCCCPNVYDNMYVKNNEDDERDKEDDNSNTTEVELAEGAWPAGEVTHTLWLQRVF